MGKTSRHTKFTFRSDGYQPLADSDGDEGSFDSLDHGVLTALFNETETDPRSEGPPGTISQSITPTVDVFDLSHPLANQTKDIPPDFVPPKQTVSARKLRLTVDTADAKDNQPQAAGLPVAVSEETESPRTKGPHPETKELTPQDKLNFFGRWVELCRFLGLLPQAIVAQEVVTGNPDFNAQMGGMVDKIGGMVIAIVLHLFFKERYKKLQSLNPVYRNAKTLATLGLELGLLISDLWLLPQVLATAVFALGIGLLAVPYWLYGEYLDRKEQKEREKAKAAGIPYVSKRKEQRNDKTGIEGWSKYGKTFLVFGMYVGEVIGTIFAFAVRGNYLLNIAIFGAIGSVASFVAGIAIVPLINKYFNKALITTKEKFRNNYIRSGITLGLAVGSVIGFILGTILFPGLGSLIGMAIGSAFGGVIGGIVLGIKGYKITTYMHDNWNVGDDPDNSWDYATRNTSYLFGFIGAAIGFFVPVPGGPLIGAAIGSAIASAFGWVAGLVVIRLARLTAPKEEKALTLPWTQRIANGTMIGSMIGAAIGFGFGFIGGPAGAILGATLGFSLGATVGGLAYGLYDEMARHLIKQFFLGKTIAVPIAIASEKKVTPVSTPIPASTPTSTSTQTPKNDPVPVDLPRRSSVELTNTKVIALLESTPTSTPTPSPPPSSPSPPLSPDIKPQVVTNVKPRRLNGFVRVSETCIIQTRASFFPTIGGRPELNGGYPLKNGGHVSPTSSLDEEYCNGDGSHRMDAEGVMNNISLLQA
jgi:MFS family permease